MFATATRCRLVGPASLARTALGWFVGVCALALLTAESLAAPIPVLYYDFEEGTLTNTANLGSLGGAGGTIKLQGTVIDGTGAPGRLRRSSRRRRFW